MDIGTLDRRAISRGADIVDTLTDLGVPERDAEIMELARTGNRTTVELTAHTRSDGARRQTDVSVNLISTEVGLILCQPLRRGASRGRKVCFHTSRAVRDLDGGA